MLLLYEVDLVLYKVRLHLMLERNVLTDKQTTAMQFLKNFWKTKKKQNKTEKINFSHLKKTN